MVGISIHAVGESVLPEILALSREIWLPSFARYFGNQELHTLYNEMYEPEKLRTWINQPENELYIVKVENVSKGYLGISYLPNQLWLDKLYVHPDIQGQGYGARLIALVVQLAINASHKSIALRVNRRNEQAVSFYLKMGFLIDGEADYPAPAGYVFDDYLMSKIIG